MSPLPRAEESIMSKHKPEPTPEVSMRTEREETGVMDAAVVQQLRLVAVMELPRGAAPESTELVPVSVQHTLERLTGPDRDSDVVSSAPRLALELTPAGLPAGESEELPQGGQMARPPGRRQPEPTEHLNQSDIIAAFELVAPASSNDDERTTVEAQRPRTARRRGPAPEATCVPGEGFVAMLEQDRQRRGIEGPPVLRAQEDASVYRLDAPIVLERPVPTPPARRSTVWVIVSVALCVILAILARTLFGV